MKAEGKLTLTNVCSFVIQKSTLRTNTVSDESIQNARVNGNLVSKGLCWINNARKVLG